ncbi:response regulator transcription factor [Candidatus Falkowbacteria bacterium]|uniref:Response regulator n=1 Tax=Candidatus Buchananbacteria bacterium CG10_big_fil_rev_8_21_14_0_10_33_19 TaxID=1974525 RepID=A0A2H0W301_9BACT|nr:response regulator transcription factor [Candidatus Falkowbacteria bacterium]PIS05714.1 MAG: response regulator [Candidatus Buchananbacteria bacterium CG10_big_fil_rev_8_21_14_0_10_33_19]
MSKKKIKALLVEDDQMIVQMYKIRMEDEGWEVFTTDRGSEAMKLAKAEKPDIILLDIILPEVDGFSILKDLRSDTTTKKIPVMMLTNLGQESDQNKGQEIGVEGYLIKSQHTPGDVITKIESLLK